MPRALRTTFYGQIIPYSIHSTPMPWKKHILLDPYYGLDLASEQATEKDAPALLTFLICGFKYHPKLRAQDPSINLNTKIPITMAPHRAFFQLFTFHSLEAILNFQTKIFTVLEFIGLQTDNNKLWNKYIKFIQSGLESDNCIEANGAALAMRMAPNGQMLPALETLVSKTSNAFGRLILIETVRQINDSGICSEALELALSTYLSDFRSEALVACKTVELIKELNSPTFLDSLKILALKTAPTPDQLTHFSRFVKKIERESNLATFFAERYGRLTFVNLMAALQNNYGNYTVESQSLCNITPSNMWTMASNPFIQLHVFAVKTLADLEISYPPITQ